MHNKKVLFKGVSFGNQEHALERNKIMNYLKKNNIMLVEDINDADVVICDTCLFYFEDSLEAIDFLNKNKNKNAILIVTGVLSAKKELVKNRKGMIFLLNDELHMLDNILKVKYRFDTINEYFFSDFGVYSIFISKGCFQECTFCVDKYGFGKLRSVEPKEIIKLFKRGVENKCKIFHLLGQNTSIYGWDINTNLASLLGNIIKIPGNYKIKLDCVNPDFLIYLEELKPILRSNKISSIRISLNAATDKILNLVGKKFKINDFITFLGWMNKYCYETELIIVLITGYPGENFKDFKKMVGFILKYSNINLIFPIYVYKDIYFAESYKLKDKVNKTEKEIRKVLIDILLILVKHVEIEMRKSSSFKKRLFDAFLHNDSYDEMLDTLLKFNKQIKLENKSLNMLFYKAIYMIEAGDRVRKKRRWPVKRCIKL